MKVLGMAAGAAMVCTLPPRLGIANGHLFSTAPARFGREKRRLYAE